MKYEIPPAGVLELRTVVLDLNGTLSVGGAVIDGVHERIDALRRIDYSVVLFTGDTRGDADRMCAALGIEWVRAADGEAKRQAVAELDPDKVVSIGNGLIDLELMKAVRLAIVTLQAEGVHVETLLASDIVVPTINDALDLLIDADRLIATLRR